jgi:hypothetical protein
MIVLTLVLLAAGFIFAVLKILEVPIRWEARVHVARRRALPGPPVRRASRLFLAVLFIAAGAALLVLILLRWLGGWIELLVS